MWSHGCHCQSRTRKGDKMDDTISRQAAIDALNNADVVVMYHEDDKVDDIVEEVILATKHSAEKSITALQSSQLDANEYRKRGEWDMFELITSVWYGKQCYFEEDNGMAYSRNSHKTMTVHDAILEFIREIGNE